MKSLNGDGPILGKEKTLMFWLQTNLLFWKHYKTTQVNVLYTKGADLAIEDELEIQKKVELAKDASKNNIMV
jgi:beta-glucosidase